MISNKFKLRYLSSLVLLNLGVAGNVMAAEDKRNVSEDESTIVITGIRGSLVRSMDMKRESDNIVDAISAQDIGKFPDQNVAESLQRITGVAIDRDGGEGQLVSVRGLGPEFNAVLVNGRTMATISGGRAFSFETLASELINGAEVHKTSKAKLQGGSIGATINITTLRPLDINDFKAVGSIKALHDDMADSTYPQLSGLISKTFADGKLGALFSVAHSKRDSRHDQAHIAGYRVDQKLQNVENLASGKTETLDNVMLPRNYDQIAHEETRERTGGTFVFQYQPDKNLTFTLDTLYSKYDLDYTQNRLAHWIERDNITKARLDANQTVTELTSEGLKSKTDFINKISHRPTETIAHGFNVNWQPSNNLKLVGDIAYSEADSRNGGRVTDVVGSYENTYTFDASSHSTLPSLRFESVETNKIYAGWAGRDGDDISDQILEVKLDGEFIFERGALAKIGFGAFYADRKLSSVEIASDRSINTLYGDNPTRVMLNSDLFYMYNADGFLSEASGDPAQKWPAFNSENVFSFLTSDEAIAKLDDPAAGRALLKEYDGYSAHPSNEAYEINEETQSLYVDFHFEGDIGLMPWSVVAGVRYVETDNLSSGKQMTINIEPEPDDKSRLRVVESRTAFTPASDKHSYSNLLPSLNAKLEVSDDIVARFAYSKSLTRPALTEMSPIFTYNGGKIDDLRGSTGNPDLSPFESTNFDLIVEWYYDEGSYAAIGGFTKDVDNFVESEHFKKLVEVESGVYEYTISRPSNVNDAKIDGYELAVQHVFNTLPEPFNGLGLIANMTFVDSESSADAAGKKLPLVGLGDSQNLILFYEHGDYQFRIAYNDREKFVQTKENYYGGEPIWVDDYYQIDVSGSYDINDNFTIFFQGINVTNELTVKKGIFDNHILDVIESGPRYSLGFRASF